MADDVRDRLFTILASQAEMTMLAQTLGVHALQMVDCR
jgi:hypothetical protein